MGRFIRTLALSVGLFMLGFAGYGEAQSGGDHYQWLLHSPLRQYLSSAAENYLLWKYGERALGPGQEEDSEEIESVWGFNVRVNDRAQDENPSLSTQSETAIAVFGENIVVGWNDSGQVFQKRSYTGYGYSSDGGRTFTDMGAPPTLPGGWNFGDPDLAVDRGGNFYFAQLCSDHRGISCIGVSKSTDGGRNFSMPVRASWSVEGPESFQDKEFIVADNTGSRFDGNIYVSWTLFSPQGSRIYFARSINGGRSFEPAIALSLPGHFVQGSIPRVGKGGEVYVAWRDFNLPGIVISKSTDGGRSFGADGVDNTLVAKVEFIGQDAPPATCQSRRILNGYIDAGFEFPTLAVNPINGEVYVAYNSNPPGVDQSDIYFVRSTDGGRTWSEPVRVNDDRTSQDQFMPAMAISPDGTLAVIWYDRRLDRANLKFDVYMAVSRDGGRTWLPNKRITTVSSEVPPLGPNFDHIRPCYMGDYNDIVADAENFYLVWGDNRAQGLTWKTLPDMPTPREATANAAAGRVIFAIGGTKLGFREAGDSDLNEAFHTQTGEWVELAPMPTPRSAAAAVGHGLSVYVLGGQSSKYGGVTGAFERYDILANRWQILPPMPTPRMALGAAVVGSRIYAIGGQNCVSLLCGQSLDVVEVYDLRTGRWVRAAPLPEPRAAFATAVVGGKIYVIGGFNAQTGEVLDSVFVYDPKSDSWSWQSWLPGARLAALAGVCGEKIIVIDGINRSFAQLRRNAWLYDTITGKWEPVAAPKFERSGVLAVNVGGVLYALGGSSSARVAHSGAGEAFDCRQLGFVRPDPDVFFAIEPLSQLSSSTVIQEARAVKLQVAAERLSRAIVFRAPARLEGLRVQIYDLQGEKIFDSGEVPGSSFQWNLSTSRGRPAATGLYLYVITARGPDGRLLKSPPKKIVVLR